MKLLNSKPLMLLIVIVGLSLAGLIIYDSLSNAKEAVGIESVDTSEIVWVKCKNPDCGFEHAINKKEYFMLMQKVADPMKPGVPAITCEKCGQDETYRTIKCEKCGEVFFYGESEDFVDRCTKCGFSKTEPIKK